MTKIRLAGYTYGAQDFCAANFAEAWLRDVQNCVAFWLGSDDFLIAETSGSTSAPKQIKLPRTLIETSAQATLSFLGIDEGCVLLAIPAKYIGGKMLVFRAMLAGLDIEVIEPKAALPEVEGTFALVSLTPLQVENSLHQLHHFQNILIGGGAISASLEDKLQSCEAAIYHTYGMTETASHVALRRVNGKTKATFFTALPGITFSADTRICLIIHAETWGLPPLATNDVVELLDDKRFIWQGRDDNVINSGGVKLHPEQIEHQLQTQIAAPFFVAGVPDEALGQKLILLVEGAERPIDLTALPKLQRPKKVYFLPQFSYTETDKINRTKTLELVFETK